MVDFVDSMKTWSRPPLNCHVRLFSPCRPHSSGVPYEWSKWLLSGTLTPEKTPGWESDRVCRKVGGLGDVALGSHSEGFQ